MAAPISVFLPANIVKRASAGRVGFFLAGSFIDCCAGAEVVAIIQTTSRGPYGIAQTTEMAAPEPSGWNFWWWFGECRW